MKARAVADDDDRDAARLREAFIPSARQALDERPGRSSVERLDEPAPGRPNVIGVARGTGGGCSLMLNAHMDTVGVAGMENPHKPVVANAGRAYCVQGAGRTLEARDGNRGESCTEAVPGEVDGCAGM